MSDLPPEAHRPDRGISPRPDYQLSIPLGEGRTFDLRCPAEMSQDDFDVVIATLGLWRPRITKQQTEPDA